MSQSAATFAALRAVSVAYLKDRQDRITEEFRLSEWPRWDWSEDTRQIIFSAAGVPKVVADAQVVGTLSTRSDTWMWGWANDSVEGHATEQLLRVRDYGESHGISQLTDKLWHAHESDGWEMTAISAYLLKAKGAYRAPSAREGFTFIVLTDIHWAD